jgi:protein-L-isoaspartate(D-aspartate) O-methyltransferase
MVEVEIAKEGITNESVLDALRLVPRHLFVPPQQRARAYLDAVLPIGYKQTISPPYIVAYMTEVLDPQKDDKVLEIGTGSGYQAAVLAEICKEVYTIEIVPELGNSAAKRLKELGYDKVQVKVGDGYKGWAEHAPFDKIIVTCSPESVPQPLADQLKEGGKMIVPLGERYQQVFVLFEKKQGKLERTKLVPTFFVAMTGQAENNRDKKPNGIPDLKNGGFEKHTNFLPDNWYCKRQVTVSQVGAPEGNSFAQFFNDEPGRGSCLYQGMSADGKKVKSIKVTAKILGKNIVAGPDDKNELAGISVLFLDSTFNMLNTVHIGPYRGSFSWRKVGSEFAVPQNAQVAVIRIGLNGATGIFGVDDVRVEPTLK